MPKVTNLAVPPDEFICPITLEIMTEPVATADGQVYERKNIKEWLERNNTSPLTSLPLANKNLIPIPLIKSQIQSFLQKNKICTENEFLAAVKTGKIDEVERLNYLDKHLHYSKIEFDVFSDIVGYKYDSDEDLNIPVEEVMSSEIIDGETALFLAVSAGHVEMVTYLLTNGANPNDSLASTGWTVLQEAISRSCVTNYRIDFTSQPTIDELLKNLETAQNQNNNNLQNETYKVEEVISKKHIEITKILLENGANPNQRDFGEDEEYPLIMAASSNLTEIVSHLIQFNADLEVFDTASGFTILHIAVANGCKDTVNLILQYAPQLIDFTDENGDTPLHVAAQKDKREIAAILLAEGANYKALNNANKTPIEVALEAGNKDIAVSISLVHQSTKRLMIKNARKVSELETHMQDQQSEINQLRDQLQKVLAHLNISEVKPSNEYSPKLFR